MDVSIFHYHLERGGVTQVVELSVRALAAHLPGLTGIRLVTGRRGGARELEQRLRDVCADNGVKLELHVIEEMDYLPLNTPSDSTQPAVERLRGRLAEAGTGSIWLVHNYHLGKNPLFTQALIETVQSDPAQRTCFYIHDFPECARFENLRFLTDIFPGSPYPIAGNVRYAVINGRDLDFLIDAGVPEKNVFLLNNPVPPDRLPGHNRDRFRSLLDRGFGGEFPGYIPGAPLMIYPVRTIRRKNALELGLIAGLSDTPVNLIVTLPGTSETERAYSEAVEGVFREGLVPGMCGIGGYLEDAGLSFPELISLADVIASSSVQEGFGYLFVNAVQWGIPLLARYLDVLDGIRGVFEGFPHHFYSSIRVPVGKETAARLRGEYLKKIGRLSDLSGGTELDGLKGEIDAVLDDSSAEFSYLTLEDQLQAVRSAQSDTGFRRETRALNHITLQELDSLIAAGRTGPKVPATWPFSFQTYAETVGSIIASFETPSGYDAGSGIQENLIRRFASLDHLRLLYAN